MTRVGYSPDASQRGRSRLLSSRWGVSVINLSFIIFGEISIIGINFVNNISNVNVNSYEFTLFSVNRMVIHIKEKDSWILNMQDEINNKIRWIYYKMDKLWNVLQLSMMAEAIRSLVECVNQFWKCNVAISVLINPIHQDFNITPGVYLSVASQKLSQFSFTNSSIPICIDCIK